MTAVIIAYLALTINEANANICSLLRQSTTARWQSGHAADCKSVYLGSTPGRASTNISKEHITNTHFLRVIIYFLYLDEGTESN